jgi:hypothetical protein
MLAMFSRILGIGALVMGTLVATYLIGNSGWIWISGSGLEARLAALKAAGDPISLPDLARAAPPPEQNAAIFLSRARKDVGSFAKELNALAARPDYDDSNLTEDDRKKLASLVNAYPQVFPLLEQAGACTTYDAQLDYTASPDAVMSTVLADATDFREVMAVLSARCRVQLAEGRHREALQTGMLVLRLARLYEKNAVLINELVVCAARGIAVGLCNQALRAGAVPDEDRIALETEAARHDGLDGFAQTLKNERAFGLSNLASIRNWVNRGYCNAEESNYLDLVQDQIDLTKAPYADFAKAMNLFKAKLSNQYPLAKAWLPAAQKTREAVERCRGMVRCLRVLNALQQAGLKPADGEPDLASLKLPVGATTDPFSETPLHVKVVDGQWLVYTVGPVQVKDDPYHWGVGPVPGK